MFHLNDGHKHPSVGFGTYKVGFIPGSASGQNGVASVPLDHDLDAILKTAIIDAEVRMVDCAAFYGNEDRVGKALKGIIPRSELYVASKIWCDAIFQGRDKIREQVLKTIDDLDVEYLDLCLVHWPVPTKHVDAFRCLLELREDGKIKSVGVSNYTIQDLEELIRETNFVPAVNQIEVNPFLFREHTIRFCREKGILIQAYRPLRNGKHMEHPLLIEIASKLNRTVSQIMGKFIVQQGMVLLSKSVRLNRIRENLDLKGFELSEQDIASLKTLTTPEAIEEAKALYRKCVVRDTPLSIDIVKTDFAFD